MGTTFYGNVLFWISSLSLPNGDSEFQIGTQCQTLELVFNWKCFTLHPDFLYFDVRTIFLFDRFYVKSQFHYFCRLFIHGIRGSPSFAGLFQDFDTDFLTENIPFNFDTYWVIYQILASPGIWLMTLLVIIISLVPYVIVEVVSVNFSQIKSFCNSIRGKNVYKVKSGPFDNSGFVA